MQALRRKTRIKRKRTLGGLLALAGTLILAACGSGGASAQSGSNLSFLVSYSGPEVALHKLYARTFPKLHPGAKLTFITPQTGSTFAKFEALTAGGTPPNIYVAQGTYAAAAMAHSALAPLPLSAFGVSSSQQLSQQYLSPALLKLYEQHGSVYGVPEQLSNYNAFFNKAEFARAGLPIPTTWNQVCADGPKLLIEKNGVPKQEEIGLPINFPDAQMEVVNAVTTEFGSPPFNAAGTKSNLTTPAVIRAFQMLQGLVYNCHAFVPAMSGSTSAAERNLFGDGASATVLDVGAWYEPVLQQQYPAVWKNVTVTPYPTLPGRPAVSPGYSYAYVVAKNVPNQSLTWKYANFLKGQCLNELKLTVTFCGLKSVAESATAKKTPFWTSVWTPTLEKAVFLPPLANGVQISKIISDAYDSILLDHANVASTLAAANQQVQPLLNK